jgi:hypothetical protein
LGLNTNATTSPAAALMLLGLKISAAPGPTWTEWVVDALLVVEVGLGLGVAIVSTELVV